MKVVRWVHTLYGLVIFTILFLAFCPLLCIPIIFPQMFKLVGFANRWWARLMFLFILVPFRVVYRTALDPKQQYIFCPNHFSYIDIPAMGLNHHNSIFVGKSDIGNIPLFGYMYARLHITVDRKNLRSRYTSVKQSLEAIDQGKSLVIFPEGGIMTKKEPVMSRFKDGAFRVAIEKQIPIVPVTIPHNWIILPPDQFLLRWHPLKVIFHEPIDTKGLTLADVDSLRERTFAIVEAELNQQLKGRFVTQKETTIPTHYEDRSRTIG
jgi:1-acyl-sn-glycerol-3-phosphate acyltransferase